MKKSTLTLLTLLNFFAFFGQQQWEALPINPNINSSVYDLEMVDGKVFQIYSENIAGTDKLIVDFYNPVSMSWQNLTSLSRPLYTKIVTEKIGNIIYIAGYNGTEFVFSKIDPTLNSIIDISGNYAAANVNNNWQFHAGMVDGNLYVLYTDLTTNSNVYGLEYDAVSSWNSMTETSSQDLSTAELQIQSTADKVFFGVMSNKLRITYFFKGNITAMLPFDGTAGEVMVEGVNWDNQGFVLTGNLLDYKALYATENANNLSYEVPIQEGTGINILLSDPSTSFNLDVSNITKESSASHGFIFSLFSSDGLGNPNDKLNVIRRDFTQAGSLWESVSPNDLETSISAIEPYSTKLSMDNGYLHLAAGYTILGASDEKIQVLNNVPQVILATDITNTGLCGGQLNEIYASLEIMDFDFDRVRIVDVISQQGQTTNIQVVPVGFNSGISKFKIFGVTTSQTDNFIVFFTDGYNTYSQILSNFTASSTAPTVQFVSDPVLFCDNEVQLDLSQYVNYYDQGTFRLNGQTVNGTQVNAKLLGTTNPTGVLRFIQNVNGCVITSLTNYQVIAAPSLSMAVTPTACADNAGSATVTVTPGLSGNLTQYWSTGETTSTISNLAPGAYYYFVIDDNNCKAQALASILSTDITITGTITHPTCYGANDGNVTINVSGTSNYQVVWSNGEFGLNLTNVSANHYECTLYDAGGCEIKKGYNLIQPAKMEVNFSSLNPDCGLSNGSITTSLTGGVAPYNYNWSTGDNTPNLSNVGNGFYVLTVTDNNNCIYKDSLFLNNSNPILVQDSIFPTDCGLANGGIDLALFETGQSGAINSVQWDNGSTEEDIFNLSAGDYLLTVNYGSNCFFQKSYEIAIKPPVKNEICVVSVDDLTTTNLVVWEKDLTAPVSYFNIYRENTVAGNYVLLDTVDFESISVFNDVIASPLHRSWRYRISAVNECGVESALSRPHKTLHLNTIEEAIPGTFDIYWDNYEGINTGTYIVNRFTDQAGWEQIATVPFGSATVHSDTPPVGVTGLDYYVGFDLAIPCTATFRAQDFDVSRSNKNKGIFNPGQGNTTFPSNSMLEQEIAANQIIIYPNPFNETLTVNVIGNNKVEIRLFDAQGKLVVNQNCNSGLNQLKTDNLNTGLFFVQIHSGNEIRTFKLSKTN